MEIHRVGQKAGVEVNFTSTLEGVKTTWYTYRLTTKVDMMSVVFLDRGQFVRIVIQIRSRNVVVFSKGARIFDADAELC